MFINSQILSLHSDTLPQGLSTLSKKAINEMSRVEKLLPLDKQRNERGMFIEKNEHLPGNARMNPDKSEPFIEYKDDVKFSENTFIHELFHVELSWGLRIPTLKSCGNNKILISCVTMLDGQFQHHIVFDKMNSLGYNNTRDSEEVGIEKDLENFDQLPHDDAYKNAWFSILYSRVQIECNSIELKESCSKLFHKHHLEESMSLGRDLESLVRQFAVENVTEYSHGLREAIQLIDLENLIEIKLLRDENT